MMWNGWLQRLRSPFCRTTGKVRRRAPAQSALGVLESLEDRKLLTINFQFDYSLDESNFFDSPQRRAILEQAAGLLESQINDSLLAIIPNGSNTWAATFSDPNSGVLVALNNLTISADNLLIFVGSRDFTDGSVAVSAPGGFSVNGSDTWYEVVAGRGQSGAVPTNGAVATDFGPWGGSLAFDTVGTDWYFGSSTSGMSPSQMDFLSVAVHELTHILGFGTCESFDRYVTGIEFVGPNVASAYDGTGSPPLAGDRAHWQDEVRDDGQETMMDPTLSPGTRKLPTGIDLAALRDIGWNTNSSGGGGGGGGSSGSLTVNNPGNLQTSESGATATFSVALSFAPTANVSVSVFSTDTGEGLLNKSTLTFTPANWNVAQQIVITGVDDVIVDGSQRYSIRFGALSSTDTRFNGVNTSEVSLTNLDNDDVGVTVTPTSGLVTTEEGGTSSFRVFLNSEPTSNVLIRVSSSDITEGRVSLSTLVFTPQNWRISQIVTVTGVDDRIADSNSLYTIILSPCSSADHAYAGLDPSDVSVMNVSIPSRTATITLGSGQSTFQAQGQPVVIDSTATVVDLDSPFLNLNGAKLVVNISNNGSNGDRLYIKSGGTVSASNSSSRITYVGRSIGTKTGGTLSSALTITLNSSANLAMVQEIVRRVQFWTSSSNKSNLDRTISYQLVLPSGETSNVASKMVSVNTGANPPVVNLGQGVLQYRVGDQLISPTASLVDTDSPNFSGGSILVSLGTTGSTGDILRIRKEGKGSGQLNVGTDGTIKLGKVIVASYSGGSAGKPLKIILRSGASPYAVQAILRNLTFGSASNNTVMNDRIVSVVVNDGDGGISVEATKTIRMNF